MISIIRTTIPVTIFMASIVNVMSIFMSNMKEAAYIAVLEVRSAEPNLHTPSQMCLNFLSYSFLSLNFFSMISVDSLFQSGGKLYLKLATVFSFTEPAKIGKTCRKKRLHATFGLSSAWKNQKWQVSNLFIIMSVVSQTPVSCVRGNELCSRLKDSKNSLRITWYALRCSPGGSWSTRLPVTHTGARSNSTGRTQAHSRSIRDFVRQSASSKTLLGWTSTRLKNKGPLRKQRVAYWGRRARIAAKTASCTLPSD